MTEHRVPRPDNRLEDGPMAPVVCAACAVSVLVRKSSWDQTSVQWQADEARQCVEREGQGATSGTARQQRACTKLTASIERAVRRGAVVILQDELGLPKSPAEAEAARQ